VESTAILRPDLWSKVCQVLVEAAEVVEMFAVELAQLAASHRVVRENTLAAVVVDEPDLAAAIDFHAGVAIHGLVVKEPAPMVGDDPDCLVDLLASLALQGEFVFGGHGASYAGATRAEWWHEKAGLPRPAGEGYKEW
jgi:hypothetical protein